MIYMINHDLINLNLFDDNGTLFNDLNQSTEVVESKSIYDYITE